MFQGYRYLHIRNLHFYNPDYPTLTHIPLHDQKGEPRESKSPFCKWGAILYDSNKLHLTLTGLLSFWPQSNQHTTLRQILTTELFLLNHLLRHLSWTLISFPFQFTYISLNSALCINNAAKAYVPFLENKAIFLK